MLSGKLLRQILDKMLTNSTVAKDARVRESHRIIMTITEEKGWKMGKVVKLKD